MSKTKPFIPVKNEATKALFSNSILDCLYRGRLHELAMARFKWNNLPEEIDERYLEMTLNEFGMAAFFKDEEVDKFCVQPCLINGPWDNYGNPLRVETWNNWNSYRRTLDKIAHNGERGDDFVVIYNNMIKSPTFPWLDYYAEQLYDIDQSRRVNTLAQKTPVLFRGTQKQQLTLKNIWLKYTGNEPLIMIDDSVDKDSFTVFKTDAPFLGEELTQMRRHMMGEIMIYLGYETQEATQKQERVLAGEVRAAQSESMSYRYSPLVMRRQAAEQINKMFGLNLEVNFRQPLSSLFEMDDPLNQFIFDKVKPANVDVISEIKEGDGDE